jgi:hypothetical protein
MLHLDTDAFKTVLWGINRTADRMRYHGTRRLTEELQTEPRYVSSLSLSATALTHRHT